MTKRQSIRALSALTTISFAALSASTVNAGGEPQAYEVVNETQAVVWLQAHPDALRFLCDTEMALRIDMIDQGLNGVLYPDIPSHDGVGMMDIVTRYAVDLTEQRHGVLFTPEAVTLLAAGEEGTYSLC